MREPHATILTLLFWVVFVGGLVAGLVVATPSPQPQVASAWGRCIDGYYFLRPSGDSAGAAGHCAGRGLTPPASWAGWGIAPTETATAR